MRKFLEKKKTIFVVVVLIFIILFIPYRKDMLWDGGSVEYKAILCKYTKVHRLANNGGYYEGVEIIFLGLKVFDNTKLVNEWENKENNEPISLTIKGNTLTNKGATFILKNDSDEEYSYVESYAIEKFENQIWKEIDTLNGAPLSWNDILYNIKPNEEREININWSFGYGELEGGKYRLVKHNIRKSNSPDSRSYHVYVEFEIPINVVAATGNTIKVKKTTLHNTNKFNEYLKRDGITIYFASNILEVYYNDVKKDMTLKYFIENVNQTTDNSIEEIVRYLEKKEIYKDGGSTVYRSKEYDITLVKCNNMSGNKDVYIGDYNMNTDVITMCSR